MKKIVKVFMIAIVAIGVSSCDTIDGSMHGEHVVVYYGNIVGMKLTPSEHGYIGIPVDVDNNGETDFTVILPNSYIDEVNALENIAIELLVVSRRPDPWYVVDVITQPNIKYSLELETQNPDTTKIIIK